MQTVTLSNGVVMPRIGYGTWKTPSGEVAASAVAYALTHGYRHVDTAACYGNEEGVGEGIRRSGLKREEIFLTSKLWNADRGYESALAAFEQSLARLGTDYLELYLIHWPANHTQFENWEQINLDSWRAMTELYRAGRIRAIGVSNFHPKHLAALLKTEVPPMVNQIELHPGFLQQSVVEFSRANGMAVEAWSPLGMGAMLQHPLICRIAEECGRSAAQVCLRFGLQRGYTVLPKSVTPARIEENLRLYDFSLSEEQMAAIAALPICGESGWDPDTVSF